MEDDDIIVYDELNPLEQSQRDILHFHSKPDDTTTYLVQLPEGVTGVNPPPQHQSSRLRQTTIVNTQRLPETEEEEQEPLEHYIKQNLSTFRKSMTPEDFQYSSVRRHSAKGDEGSVIVMPVSTEEIEADRTFKKPESDKEISVEAQEAVPPTQIKNTTVDVKDVKNNETIVKTPNIKIKKNFPFQFNNGITVMPAISDHVEVIHNSPFSSEAIEYNRRPSSRVKVLVMIKSSSEDEESEADKKYKHRKPDKQDSSRKNVGYSGRKYRDKDVSHQEIGHNNYENTKNRAKTPKKDPQSEKTHDEQVKRGKKSKKKLRSPEDSNGNQESIWPPGHAPHMHKTHRQHGSTGSEDSSEESHSRSRNARPTSKNKYRDNEGKSNDLKKSKKQNNNSSHDNEGKSNDFKKSKKQNSNSSHDNEGKRNDFKKSKKQNNNTSLERGKSVEKPRADKEGSRHDDVNETKQPRKHKPKIMWSASTKLGSPTDFSDESLDEIDKPSGETSGTGKNGKKTRKPTVYVKQGRSSDESTDTVSVLSGTSEKGKGKNTNQSTNEAKRKTNKNKPKEQKSLKDDSLSSSDETSDDGVKASPLNGKAHHEKENDKKHPNKHQSPDEYRRPKNSPYTDSVKTNRKQDPSVSPVKEKPGDDRPGRPKDDRNRGEKKDAGKSPEKEGRYNHLPQTSYPDDKRPLRDDNDKAYAPTKPSKKTDGDASPSKGKRPVVERDRTGEKIPEEGKKKGQDGKKPPKYLAVNAPKSATKIMTRRRYHIMIPEHGREETPFNLRFNITDENTVDWNYKGPVKITNYYSANKYE